MKVGDVVQLKSGGPEMTIMKMLENEKIECMWFALHAELFRTDLFVAGVLEPVVVEVEAPLTISSFDTRLP